MRKRNEGAAFEQGSASGADPLGVDILQCRRQGSRRYHSRGCEVAQRRE